MKRIPRFAMITAVLAIALCGCRSVKQVRVENVSKHDLTTVRVAGQTYGDLAPGETSDYKSVTLRARYAPVEMQVDGKNVTAQTLNFGANRFTYRIDVKDLPAGHLAIIVIREESDDAG